MPQSAMHVGPTVYAHRIYQTHSSRNSNNNNIHPKFNFKFNIDAFKANQTRLNNTAERIQIDYATIVDFAVHTNFTSKKLTASISPQNIYLFYSRCLFSFVFLLENALTKMNQFYIVL